MTTWKISNYHKKNAVELQFWTKDGKTIIREEGFRWGSWYCESDEKPNVDLKNPDGYEVSWTTDYEWELDMMDDGCWAETRAGDYATDEDVEEFEELWEEDSYEAVEGAGWENVDTEYWIYGPLELTNEDTGESWNGVDNGNEENN